MATTNTSNPQPGPASAAPNSVNTGRIVTPNVNTQNGTPLFLHKTTAESLFDTVKLEMEVMSVVPIVFVPGVMGTNLTYTKTNGKKEIAWRVDSGLKTLTKSGFKNAAERQEILHPNTTQVDPNGEIPFLDGRIQPRLRARGWGEVGASSYKDFLVWLEDSLNGGASKRKHINSTLQKMRDAAAWRPQKTFSPLTASECQSAERWQHPVYAVGYNWLQSNAESAERLRDRINEIIQENNQGFAQCEKVIVVTHSMGGLVTRACCKLPGMEDKIAGVVHGVMPAIGAAAAYTRCKIGTQDETPSGLIDGKIQDWGGAQVMGETGADVTVVFAQAPGPLQLLPSKQYPRDWLQVRDTDGSLLPGQPDASDPYETIYKERHKWWGLIKEDWLFPKGGTRLPWETFTKNIKTASKFHADIEDYYHPNTWGFYGQGRGTYERVVWTLDKYPHKSIYAPKNSDLSLATVSNVMDLTHTREKLLEGNVIIEDGSNPIGITRVEKGKNPALLMPFTDWELRLPMPDPKVTGTGDGTVSIASGRAPVASAHVKQLFCIPNIAHEGCYRDSPDARNATLYAINKIVAPLVLIKAKARQ